MNRTQKVFWAVVGTACIIVVGGNLMRVKSTPRVQVARDPLVETLATQAAEQANIQDIQATAIANMATPVIQPMNTPQPTATAIATPPTDMLITTQSPPTATPKPPPTATPAPTTWTEEWVRQTYGIPANVILTRCGDKCFEANGFKQGIGAFSFNNVDSCWHDGYRAVDAGGPQRPGFTDSRIGIPGNWTGKIEGFSLWPCQ